MVGSYGGRDTMGVSHPERLEAALTALGVPHDVKVYPEAGHGFMSPGRPRWPRCTALARLQYDKGAAEDAWQRIFAFFGTLPAGLETLAGVRVEVVVDEAVGSAASPTLTVSHWQQGRYPSISGKSV